MAPENSSNYGYGITIADVVTIIAAIHFSSSHSGIEVDDFGKFAMVFVCIDALASIFTAFSALLYSKRRDPSGPIFIAFFIPTLVYHMSKILPHEGYKEFIVALTFSVVIRALVMFEALPPTLPNSELSGYLFPRVGPVLIAISCTLVITIYMAMGDIGSPFASLRFMLFYYGVHAVLSLPGVQRRFESLAYRWYA